MSLIASLTLTVMCVCLGIGFLWILSAFVRLCVFIFTIGRYIASTDSEKEIIRRKVFGSNE